jgi:hypothetical protein
MSAKHQDTQKHSKQPKTLPTGKTERMRDKDDAVRRADEAAQKDKDTEKRPDRTAGQNRAVDQKRNDEQQSHAGGVTHDPHNRTQERVDKGDSEAGDVDEETRSVDAPYNKTYGRRE